MTCKSNDGVDHVAHGWALLAFRLPEIRPFRDQREVREVVAEICEHYSIGVVNTRKLRQRGVDGCEFYDALLLEMEDAVSTYVQDYARRNR